MFFSVAEGEKYPRLKFFIFVIAMPFKELILAKSQTAKKRDCCDTLARVAIPQSGIIQWQFSDNTVTIQS